jgi:hypothetical protein
MKQLNAVQTHAARYGLLGLYDACEVVGMGITNADAHVFLIVEASGEVHRYKNDEIGVKLAWMMLESKLEFLKRAYAWWTDKALPPEVWNGRSYDYNWFDGSKGYRCLEHTLSDYYGGSVTRFVAMLTNEDTSFEDVFGNRLIAIHEDSLNRSECDEEEWYPEGAYCEHKECDVELEEPLEERNWG